jgi:hypothetical protein
MTVSEDFFVQNTSFQFWHELRLKYTTWEINVCLEKQYVRDLQWLNLAHELYVTYSD